LFGRSRKCHFCGAKEGLSTCSCGKRFCPLHGVSGQCTECYSKGLMGQTGTIARVTDGGKGPGKTVRKGEVSRSGGKKRVPRAGSSISFDHIGVGALTDVLERGLRTHHFICFVKRRVALFEKEGEIEVLYHGDRILNSIRFSAGEVKLSTDLRRVPPEALERVDPGNLGANLRNVPNDLEVYRGLLHHNEISWLVQTVVISLGAEVSRANLEWRLEELPVRAYGPMCPWCGTSVAAQGKRCRFCEREVPPTVPADEFIRRHLKRQFTDKVIGIKSLRREGRIGPEAYADARARLGALLESIDRVSWTGLKGQT